MRLTFRSRNTDIARGVSVNVDAVQVLREQLRKPPMVVTE